LSKRWTPPPDIDETHPEWKKWKKVGHKPPEHFICYSCGAAVFRPGRSWDDVADKCAACWENKPIGHYSEAEMVKREIETAMAKLKSKIKGWD
jgi:hypothetical protein